MEGGCAVTNFAPGDIILKRGPGPKPKGKYTGHQTTDGHRSLKDTVSMAWLMVRLYRKGAE